MSHGIDATRPTVALGLGGAVALAGLGGCTAAKPGSAGHCARPLSHRPFIAPRVSADRVVRVVVGHRPYHPPGFVVRRETFDGKAVIHNYGHGGGRS